MSCVLVSSHSQAVLWTVLTCLCFPCFRAKAAKTHCNEQELAKSLLSRLRLKISAEWPMTHFARANEKQTRSCYFCITNKPVQYHEQSVAATASMVVSFGVFFDNTCIDSCLPLWYPPDASLLLLTFVWGLAVSMIGWSPVMHLSGCWWRNVVILSSQALLPMTQCWDGDTPFCQNQTSGFFNIAGLCWNCDLEIFINEARCLRICMKRGVSVQQNSLEKIHCHWSSALFSISKDYVRT